jgi:hypothetical protein
MKRRYLYPLMYSVPALVVSAIFTAVLTGAVWGLLWLFVFGDDTWPPFVERSAPILMFVVLATGWVWLLWAAYAWGKRQEIHVRLNMAHAYLAAGSTAALVLLVFLHQLSVGNIGPPPDPVLCAEFCAARSFGSSRVPHDGTCRRYRADGGEALNVSIDSLRASQP